mgnify:FL=1
MKKKPEKKQLTLMQKTKLIIGKLFFVTLGALIAAFALEGFLIPNNIIDGGIIGISMMTSYITKLNLGAIIVLFNLPFLFLGYKKMGKMFVATVLYGVSMLGIFVNLIHNTQVTESDLLATVFGGIILGFGVGLILRNDGALDGTEILSISIAKKLGFSVGEIIMFFNFFIYSAAGFLYGWDSAMYSILTYFIAYRVIDIVLEGLNSSKSIYIVTNFAKEIGDSIIKELNISVTYMKGKGGYSGKEQTIIYCVVSRLEIAKIKALIRENDPSAFYFIQDVHEVEGIRVKKK